MFKEVLSLMSSSVENKPINLRNQKMKDLVQKNERISRMNRSLNKELEKIRELSLKENKELKVKILILENKLKDSNERLGVLKHEIELRDDSLDRAKRLENVLRVKLSEHENQERVFNDKLNETNKVINKMSSRSNKIETLIKIGKHPSDKRGLRYVNEKITPSTNKSTFVKTSSKLNVGTLSNGKAMDATGGASTLTIDVKEKIQQGQRQYSSSSNEKGKASRVIHQRVYHLPPRSNLPDMFPHSDDSFLLHSVVVPRAAIKDATSTLDSVPSDWFTTRKKTGFH
ncbi:hypothetical protein Dsin_021561 [Dipteronia sinensis]|uniref:Uncharacterized protein n=1 Tax=Dipteronia sinensis TaxID=43782 RepID=A0AAE0DZ41_9ROSI|nr:hypothetical protein Dsin_021561 [Dipteronia sinensis]